MESFRNFDGKYLEEMKKQVKKKIVKNIRCMADY